jgi:hypothetical protein
MGDTDLSCVKSIGFDKSDPGLVRSIRGAREVCESGMRKLSGDGSREVLDVAVRDLTDSGDGEVWSARVDPWECSQDDSLRRTVTKAN